ncbi:hypothetical protein A3712_09935 [Vibrio sp. HI00D65]|nr:hypothetical protein A3712_09935 [Vibrio sp. HI00D65]
MKVLGFSEGSGITVGFLAFWLFRQKRWMSGIALVKKMAVRVLKTGQVREVQMSADFTWRICVVLMETRSVQLTLYRSSRYAAVRLYHSDV